jgi:hypothetical protein
MAPQMAILAMFGIGYPNLLARNSFQCPLSARALDIPERISARSLQSPTLGGRAFKSVVRFLNIPQSGLAVSFAIIMIRLSICGSLRVPKPENSSQRAPHLGQGTDTCWRAVS